MLHGRCGMSDRPGRGRWCRPPIEQRMDAKSERVPFSTCVYWLGASIRGYGCIHYQGRTRLAHQVAWELRHAKPWPVDRTADHLCRTPCCVNPDHIEPVTVRVNTLRGIGLTARYAQRTHCTHGHLLAPGNISIRRESPGHRNCLACANARQKAYRRRKRNHPSTVLMNEAS